MAGTTSLAFPNMFNVARNTVSVLEDGTSVVNRVRLLMLTEPTELYNNIDFGVGLKQYLWQYNTENVKAIIQDRIKSQIREYEPSVRSEEVQFEDGLLFSGGTISENAAIEANHLKFTVGLVTKYGDKLEVDLSDLQTILDGVTTKYSS